MAKTKKAEIIATLDPTMGAEKTVMVFKASRPMSEAEFELLSNMVRAEQERSGVAIVCVPYSADLEIRETKPKKVAEKAGE